MATPKLLLSKLLRRRLTAISTFSSSSYSYSSLVSPRHVSQHFINRANENSISGLPPSAWNYLAPQHNLLFFRSIHTRDPEYDEFRDLISATQSVDELDGLGVRADTDDGAAAEAAAAVIDTIGDGGSGDGSILPVRLLISLLDGYHDLTGFPWWVVIVSSTIALRIALLPLLILQLKKLKQIADSFQKLPPPFPPPSSGRSHTEQLTLFRREKKAVGCPSYLWFLAYASVQIPCFFLGVTSIRKMSLDHHAGFDCGGVLWFQNLTEIPHGVLGPIFPLLIAGLHYTNIQISFQTSSIGKTTGLFGRLVRYYRIYLEVMTLPLLFIGFCIPQGSLVYWVTNSSFTLIQQLSLNHPDVRQKLGLPDKLNPAATAKPEESETSKKPQADLVRKQGKIHAQDMTPRELLGLSVKFLAKGERERALPLLRLAIDKDPDYVRAIVVMGQALLQKGELAEATEYLERAISKVSQPKDLEETDLLIIASQWAGVACIRQGRNADGIGYLERVANSKEPEDAKSKAHYYDAFLLLASALYQEGRKLDAAKYLRRAVAYNPAYNEYLEQCLNDNEDFVSDLTSSRRKDY